MSLRALLVEDDEDIRAVGRVALSVVAGWEVHTAVDGFAALELAPQVLPDVILMDMMMPGMDGVACFQRMQEVPEIAHIPIVFLTAKVQRGEVEKYTALGAAGVIHKPFDPMSLASDVLALIR